MSFLGRLFGKKDTVEEVDDGSPKMDRSLVRMQKKLMNKYHQTMERKRIIYILKDIGSDDAIRVLLGRFTYVTDGSIVDEDEKTLTYEIIRSFGDRALPALEGFIRDEVSIYWALRAYTEIAGDDAAVELILSCLDAIHDRFDRSMEKMSNLVSSLRDYQHPDVLGRLIELSKDESEEIRFLASDGLTMYAEHREAVDAMLERLIDEEETTRLKTYIVDQAIENRWNVKRFKKTLSERIPEGYFVDDTGIIQRRSF